MKKLFKSIVILSLTILVLGYSNTAFAGNQDRLGQAGATELLITLPLILRTILYKQFCPTYMPISSR
jgi:hypothetical protein